MIPAQGAIVDAPPVEAFGARLVPGQGVRFSVWAPHAQSVSVIGDFNGWRREAAPMTPSPGGVWMATVPDAGAGSLLPL